MAASTPKRPPLTHFLCIPLVTPASRSQLSRSLAEFREDVTSENSFAVPPGAVRPLGTLHLTLGVMSLREEGKLEEATSLLRGLKLGEILDSVREAAKERMGKAVTAVGQTASGEDRITIGEETLTISLKGLQTMHKPAQAKVLYAAPVDARGLLYPFCERVRTAFVDAGLMVDEKRALLLHATVVNTIYARRGGRGAAVRGKKPLTLDARVLLDRYEDFMWMDNQVVEGVALCKMGAKEVEGEDEQVYEEVARVGL
ncbi:hypothetical protein jhhlp_005534 [Lomentospora prolificans]|uniref:A-kinase anchor protein 7-like phosphoesterase domain-containing protein n=1 Tax=Lomentospora prolificans TaxID=41688 RepID=A0A2N3N3D4_9PEZI|nr:hypothetical protein jhhlp_005534 [Lomentospora prolificans]